MIMDIQQIDKQYVAATYARFPLTLVKGKGSLVYDENGKEYIDLGTGIAVNTFGASDEIWKNAVIEQLDKIQHTSNLYYSEPCALLAQTLCEKTGMKKVFFSNSGAEANECAIKAARKYGADKKGKEYCTIVTLKNSFHGRTITTLSATGQEVFHEHFTPMTEGFVHATANDFKEMQALVEANKCCGIMLELVQGEGGVQALDKEYVQQVAALAKQEDLLLIVDEVQTGNGRTGALYAYMHYGISPDVVSTAKGIGGGLPLGATMLSEKVQNVLGFGDHGSTYGGNPIACAGGYSVVSRLDDAFLGEVKAKSDYVFEAFRASKGVKSVSGMGLMIGIETEKPAAEIVKACIERGVLCLTAKHKLRLLPALNIPMDVLKEAVEAIRSVIEA